MSASVTLDYQSFHVYAELLARVADELSRQDLLWGEQNHPLTVPQYSTHVGGTKGMSPAYYADQAEQWKVANDTRAQNDVLDWDGILLEEVYEALGESDPSKAIVELLQVAAVAINAAVSVQRNGLAGRS